MTNPTDETGTGLICALGAYICWGFMPLYFKLLVEVHPFEIIVHRIIWCLAMTAFLLLILRRRESLRFLFSNRKYIAQLATSAFLVAINWTVFAWAVVNNQVLDTSLGYYINPLFSVLLGVIVLRETLRGPQRAAVLIAAIAVGVLIWQYGRLPWVSLTLATTFGLYGFIRKHVPVDNITGLFTETLVLLPISLGYWGYLTAQDASTFNEAQMSLRTFLILSGPVTMVPLLLFAAGARRLPLSTIGMMQYLAPTISFLLAVFAFNEPLSPGRVAAFVLIWIALAIFSADSWYTVRRTAALRD